MNYLRHIILFSGILVIVTFFTRISRNALNDGFFAKIEELNTRNSQEWDRVQLNLPSDNQEGIVSPLDFRVHLCSNTEYSIFTGFTFQGLPNVGLATLNMTHEWLLGCFQNCLPGFAQAP